MAQQAHAFTEVTTDQTTSSATYVDITGATIASGEFVTSREYLIVVEVQYKPEGTSNVVGVRVLHDSTPFADSDMLAEGRDSAVQHMYKWFTKWTAVSGEGIKVQFHSNGTITMGADQITLFALDLTDLDFNYAERATDDLNIGTSDVNGAAVTFTPAGSEDWLVMVNAQYDDADTGPVIQTRISRSGEATSEVPECIVTGKDVVDLPVVTQLRAFSLTNTSNTFTEKSKASGSSSWDRLHSRVFVLEMNMFQNYTFGWTPGEVDLPSSDYTQLMETEGITPDITGDTWIQGQWNSDLDDSGEEVKSRLQVNGSDQPATQTSDAYFFMELWDSNERHGIHHQTVEALTADTLYTIDMDGSMSATTGAGKGGLERSLVAMTMELLTSFSLEQEGFRFRNDDGSESAATWRQSQDVVDTVARNTNVRLRVLVNATGDPPSKQYGLEYKESSDPAAEWREVPLS